MFEPLAMQLRQDLMLVLLYFACHWPLPQLMQAVFHYVLRNPADMEIAVGSQHRWYLMFVIACRMLHHIYRPLAAKLQVRDASLLLPVGVTVTLAISCLAVFSPHHAPNMCRGGISRHSWYAQLLRWLIEVEGPGDALGSAMKQGQCGVLAQWHWDLCKWMVPIYTLVWWSGGAGSSVRSFVEAHRGNRAAVMALLVTLCGVLCINGHFARRMVENDSKTPVLAVNFIIAVAILLTAGLAAGSPALKYSLLPQMGRSSLGAYLVHSWLTGEDARLKHEKVSGFLSEWGHGGQSTHGWGQIGFSVFGQQLVPDMKTVWDYLVGNHAPSLCLLAFLLLAPVPFLLTVAPLFQQFVVKSLSTLLRLLDAIFNRAAKLA
jgi:hypothetical protein